MIKSFYTDSRKFVVCRINYDPTKERISSKVYGNSHKVEVGFISCIRQCKSEASKCSFSTVHVTYAYM